MCNRRWSCKEEDIPSWLGLLAYMGHHTRTAFILLLYIVLFSLRAMSCPPTAPPQSSVRFTGTNLEAGCPRCKHGIATSPFCLVEYKSVIGLILLHCQSTRNNATLEYNSLLMNSDSVVSEHVVQSTKCYLS
jgi:hypothetical protein